ncbi:MAG: S6e family ribosomal protein [Nanoarchaeota archaeon]
MVFKINIGSKTGKTFKLETEAESLIGKSLKDKISGNEILPALEGWEFEIAGLSDNSGFASHEKVEGIGLKKILLPYGKGMHQKPKGDKKINKKPAGLRLRKTVRGKIISPAISQINLRIIKEGSKSLEDAFPDQSGKPSESQETSEGGENKESVAENK